MQSIDDIDYSVLAEEGGIDTENQEQDVNEQQNDFQYTVKEPTVENPPANEEPVDNKPIEVLPEFLKSLGISDLEHIKFLDDDDIVKDVSWNDLSNEEKLNLLQTSIPQPERDLTDDEISLINNIRSSRLSPKQFIDTMYQKGAQDYINSLQNTPNYSIDDLSDDEVFMLDLQEKIEDISEDELKAALDKAKEDPLYERRVTGIRKNLKEQEEQLKKQTELEQQQTQEEQFNQFKNAVLQGIQSFNKVGDLDIQLENDDMNDIASFILDRDETGLSYFGKALNDPATLVEMAWWTLKGRDMLKSISDSIQDIRQKSYQKGLEDAGKKPSTKVVYKKSSTNNPVNSIDDIYDNIYS